MNFMAFYFGLLCLLDFLGVIFNLKLGSFPSIVHCVLRFSFACVYLHVHIGVPGRFSIMNPKRVSKWMQIVECGSTLDNMVWCCGHISVVNSDDKEGLHWFVYAFDCRVRLERFIIWVWEPLSSISMKHPFLTALKKYGLTTKHWASGLQKDGWSCGFQSSHTTNLVVDH